MWPAIIFVFCYLLSLLLRLPFLLFEDDFSFVSPRRTEVGSVHDVNDAFVALHTVDLFRPTLMILYRTKHDFAHTRKMHVLAYKRGKKLPYSICCKITAFHFLMFVNIFFCVCACSWINTIGDKMEDSLRKYPIIYLPFTSLSLYLDLSRKGVEFLACVCIYIDLPVVVSYILQLLLLLNTLSYHDDDCKSNASSYGSFPKRARIYICVCIFGCGCLVSSFGRYIIVFTCMCIFFRRRRRRRFSVLVRTKKKKSFLSSCRLKLSIFFFPVLMNDTP